MYFNKRLTEELKLGDMYSLVNEGKWTVDKLIEFAKTGTSDLDGDTKMGLSDRYGFVTGAYMETDAFINSCDVVITEHESDGTPKLVGLTQHYIDVQEKIRAFIKDSGDVYYDSAANPTRTLFRDDLGLFEAAALKKG